MGQTGSFISGTIVGALLLAGALHYHVVRSESGVAVVPKVGQSLAGSYVDIRGFTREDWQRHQPLAAALRQAREGGERSDSGGSGRGPSRLRPAIDSMLDRLLGSQP